MGIQEVDGKGRADEIRDWWDAEVESVRLRDSMRRVAGLEVLAEAGEASEMPVDGIGSRSNLVADARQAPQRLVAENVVSRLLAEAAQFTETALGILQGICESLDCEIILEAGELLFSVVNPETRAMSQG